MKTCPVCHLKLQEGYEFCPEDGSSLRDEAQLDSKPLDEPKTAPLLYCPVCAAEYPLTFTNCPYHGAQLTMQKIVASVKQPSNSAIESILPNDRAVQPGEQESATDYQSRASVETFSNEKPKAPDDERDQTSIVSSEARFIPTTGDTIAHASRPQPSKSGRISASESGPSPATRSHRITAVIMVIVLVVFAILGGNVIYTMIFGKRPIKIVSVLPPYKLTFKFDISTKPDPPPVPEPSLEPPNPGVLPPTTEQADSSTNNSDTPSGVPSPRQRLNKPQSGIVKPKPRIHVKPIVAKVVRPSRRHSARFDIRAIIKETTGRKAQIRGVSIRPCLAKGKGKIIKLPLRRGDGFDAKGKFKLDKSVSIPGYKEADWKGGVEIIIFYACNSSEILEKSYPAVVTFENGISQGKRPGNRFPDIKRRGRNGAVGTH